MIDLQTFKDTKFEIQQMVIFYQKPHLLENHGIGRFGLKTHNDFETENYGLVSEV